MRRKIGKQNRCLGPIYGQNSKSTTIAAAFQQNHGPIDCSARAHALTFKYRGICFLSHSVLQVSNISSSPSSFHSSPFFTIEFHHFRLFRFLKLKKINNRILQKTILKSKEDSPVFRQTQGNRS
ncbi:hypothetical protein SLE2022_211170 [Rubroshorea leprosula]